MDIINIKDNAHEEEGVQENPLVQSYGDGFCWTRGRLLGKGGFGSVFIATMRYPMNSVIVVKSAEIAHSDSLRHEKKVLTSLVGCSNVIQCLGEEITIEINGSKVYDLLLECGLGGSLAERIFNAKGKRLPEFEVRQYTRSILQGLVEIHEVGYIHCDLKPENILLVPRKNNQEFMAKICDFGLAKGIIYAQKRELEGNWQGTPLFYPPKVVKECLQEAPEDIWSLGCTVLKMLTGSVTIEWEEGSSCAKENIITKLFKGVPKIPKELSEDAKSFLTCCLTRMTKNRPTTKKSLSCHPFVRGSNNEDDNTKLYSCEAKAVEAKTVEDVGSSCDEVPRWFF